MCYKCLFCNFCSVFTGLLVNVCLCAGDVEGGIFLPLGWCMCSAEENDVERLGTQGGVLNF